MADNWNDLPANTFEQIADALEEMHENTTDEYVENELETMIPEIRKVAESWRPSDVGKVIRSPDPPEDFEPGDIWKDTSWEK